MPTLTITYSTPEERRDYERAIAFVAEMHQLVFRPRMAASSTLVKHFVSPKGATFFGRP